MLSSQGSSLLYDTYRGSTKLERVACDDGVRPYRCLNRHDRSSKGRGSGHARVACDNGGTPVTNASVRMIAGAKAAAARGSPQASALIESAVGFRSVTSPLEVLLDNGRYTLTLYAVDRAGNAGTTGARAPTHPPCSPTVLPFVALSSWCNVQYSRWDRGFEGNLIEQFVVNMLYNIMLRSLVCC